MAQIGSFCPQNDHEGIHFSKSGFPLNKLKVKQIIIVAAFFFFLLGFALKAQQQFTNNGNFYVHSETKISFFGDLINNGSIVDSGLGITLSGTNAQEIGGSSVTTFNNLTLNNSAGAYLSANEEITGELKILNGTFTTTGFNFRLLSNMVSTAHIAPILGDFSGNITMERYLDSGATSWRFLASPVSGVTINDWQDDFATSGFPGSSSPGFSFISVYTYDEAVSGAKTLGYVGATDANDTLIPGLGFWCYVGPVPLTIDVTGPPTKFNHSFSVTHTSSGSAADDGWVLIGNPYPSDIDWASASWTKNNINDAVYIWNSANQQYASWIGGLSTNGGSNIIASSQSFWIQTNGSNPALSITENCKISGNEPFLRQKKSKSLGVVKLSLFGNNFKDETVLQFDNEGTKVYDAKLDARKLFSSNPLVPGIATQDSTGTDLSINSLPTIDSSVSIPVKTTVGVSGTYTISLDSTFIAPSGFDIVLEDLYAGMITDLDSLSSYSFVISDTTTVARFLLHIVKGIFEEERTSHTTSSVFVYPNPAKNNLTIEISENLLDGKVEVINLIGVEIAAFTVNSISTVMDVSALPAGIYFIIIYENNTNRKWHTTKLIIQD